MKPLSLLTSGLFALSIPFALSAVITAEKTGTSQSYAK